MTYAPWREHIDIFGDPLQNERAQIKTDDWIRKYENNSLYLPVNAWIVVSIWIRFPRPTHISFVSVTMDGSPRRWSFTNSIPPWNLCSNWNSVGFQYSYLVHSRKSSLSVWPLPCRYFQTPGPTPFGQTGGQFLLNGDWKGSCYFPFGPLI